MTSECRPATSRGDPGGWSRRSTAIGWGWRPRRSGRTAAVVLAAVLVVALLAPLGMAGQVVPAEDDDEMTPGESMSATVGSEEVRIQESVRQGAIEHALRSAETDVALAGALSTHYERQERTITALEDDAAALERDWAAGELTAGEFAARLAILDARQDAALVAATQLNESSAVLEEDALAAENLAHGDFRALEERAAAVSVTAVTGTAGEVTVEEPVGADLPAAFEEFLSGIGLELDPAFDHWEGAFAGVDADGELENPDAFEAREDFEDWDAVIVGLDDDVTVESVDGALVGDELVFELRVSTDLDLTAGELHDELDDDIELEPPDDEESDEGDDEPELLSNESAIERWDLVLEDVDVVATIETGDETLMFEYWETALSLDDDLQAWDEAFSDAELLERWTDAVAQLDDDDDADENDDEEDENDGDDLLSNASALERWDLVLEDVDVVAVVESGDEALMFDHWETAISLDADLQAWDDAYSDAELFERWTDAVED